MTMTQASDSERHLSRATVVAAVIGAVGVIAAAMIAHRAGQEQSSRKLDVMEKQLAESSAAIVELRNALNTEAQKVTALIRFERLRACWLESDLRSSGHEPRR